MPGTTAKKQGADFIPMIKTVATLAVCALFFLSCKDNNENNNSDFFAPVPVYLSINLNLPNYAPLANVQGYVYEAGGNKGIVIYHNIFNEYVAFDRTCPVNTQNACSYVSVDSSSVYFRCGQYSPNWAPCCNSKFDPSSGNPIEGEAKRALKQYTVKQEGSMLLITNTP